MPNSIQPVEMNGFKHPATAMLKTNLILEFSLAQEWDWRLGQALDIKEQRSQNLID